MAFRSDNRTPEQMRPVRITPDYIGMAEGSALIEVGHTKVICTASIEEGVPGFLRNTGKGWITAEYGMLPRANLTLLGERTIHLDCDVIQADGGTRTASITGAYVALALAVNRLLAAKTLKKSPLRDSVAATSVGIVDGTILLDLAYEEDSRAEVDMNLVMTGSGRFVEVQATAEQVAFGDSQLAELIRVAKQGITDLLALQTAALERAQ